MLNFVQVLDCEMLQELLDPTIACHSWCLEVKLEMDSPVFCQLKVEPIAWSKAKIDYFSLWAYLATVRQHVWQA